MTARVLLIEDEPGIRTLVAEVCRNEGYEVIEAAAGRPGVQAAIANQPDIALLDWVLPDISGIEVCRETEVEVGVGTTGVLDVVQLHQARVHVVLIKFYHSGSFMCSTEGHSR